jgi:FMN-dependent NADH-azoreductase
MTKILHLSSSVDWQNSTSREIGRYLIEQLKAAHPDIHVTHRDLANDTPPHIGPDFFNALPTSTAEALAISRELVAELLEADRLVIEAPMYNFTIPSTLKAWIDHIVRYDLTVKISEQGREGLLSNVRLSSCSAAEESIPMALRDRWITRNRICAPSSDLSGSPM